MTTIETHEIASIFPMMTPEEFLALKEDIKAKGLLEPVWMYEGRILDGRNRFKACQEVGVAIETREYEGTDPVGFVLSLNLARRHLSESQRAMVAAKIANITKADAGKIGAAAQGKATANLQLLDKPMVSQSQAATMLNVSERTVASAKKVTEQGVPELVEQVQAGNVSVSTAEDGDFTLRPSALRSAYHVDFKSNPSKLVVSARAWEISSIFLWSLTSRV